jgi:hypothetical protein
MAPSLPDRVFQAGLGLLFQATSLVFLLFQARVMPLARHLGRVPLRWLPGEVSRHPGYRRLVRRVRDRLPESAAAYRSSHRGILIDITPAGVVPDNSPALELGAVFLPASRSFRNELPGLELAAELALNQGCPLVVACSGEAKAAAFPPELRERLGRHLFVFDFDKVDPGWRPALASDSLRLGDHHRKNDAAHKRNLVLALAPLLGWKSVLLLDDDIHAYTDGRPTLDKVGLNLALAALYQDPALHLIGWSATDCPDNSVVGHIRRLTGLEQTVFFGAGALLIRIGGPGRSGTTCFPNMYNHDWMFMIAQASRAADPLRSLGIAGEVRQLQGKTIRSSRARSEEPGDIFGEGLMNLFERFGGNWHRGSTRSYWRAVLRHRRNLIHSLSAEVAVRLERPVLERTGAGGSFYELGQARDSLVTALRVAERLLPGQFFGYVTAWLEDDRTNWPDHLAGLEQTFAPVIDQARPASGRWGDMLDQILVIEQILLVQAERPSAPTPPKTPTDVAVAA